LGGNNAAIVLADADLEVAAATLADSAFAFCGQRCTAIRRFVVEKPVAARFRDLVVAAMAGVRVGDPAAETTDAGPLISADSRVRVEAAIAAASAAGATQSVGVDPGRGGGWMAPVLLSGVAPETRIAQEETFGPVAMILTAADVDEAIAIANCVEQGLVLSVHTKDGAARARVLRAARVGVVQADGSPLRVHPDAPFGGWKASGLGPPEHGRWDAQFFSRPQARYGLDDDDQAR
jgi:acyl-CoA reductase-like NAD-dependent aldehyde dehydrogenase